MPTPNELIQAILDQRKNQADLKDLATEFLSQFNGVKGVMKEIKATYDNAQTADSRTKILLAGVDLIKQVSANAKAAADPLEDLSDEELRQTLVAATGGVQ